MKNFKLAAKNAPSIKWTTASAAPKLAVIVSKGGGGWRKPPKGVERVGPLDLRTVRPNVS